MGLETVVEDIREEARERAEEIRAEADAEAAEIIEAAEADAEERISAAEREVERRIEQEREQAHSSAKLEAKQTRLESRRDLLAELRERLEAQIEALEGDRREELTRTLLTDAVSEYPEDAPLTVRGHPKDAELLEDLVAEHEAAEYTGTTDCLGGVIVGSEESRITIDNTFDALLEQMWEDNLKRLSASLFEQEQ